MEVKKEGGDLSVNSDFDICSFGDRRPDSFNHRHGGPSLPRFHRDEKDAKEGKLNIVAFILSFSYAKGS
jgi:hypothetical protein